MHTPKPLLLAINLEDYQPRLLTSTDDKTYLVLFSSLKQVHIEKENATSLLGLPSSALLELAANSTADGAVINPWGQRLTIARQDLRAAYYGYAVEQYVQDAWWQSPLWAHDYDALMWDGGEPYDEAWLVDFIASQNYVDRHVAWWAQEQKPTMKKPPFFMQLWLAFYGLYWLQCIFGTGLNTLYSKEIDRAGLYLTTFLTLGLYFIFRYLPRFNDWWYAREAKQKEAEEQRAWELAAPQREAERLAREEEERRQEERAVREEMSKQQSLQAFASELDN